MPRLLVVIILSGCAMSPGTPPNAVSVVRVIDGDSLIVEAAGGQIEIRLSGVNTPERGECLHAEAAQALATLIDGARLTLSIEGTDQHGRTLGRLDAGGIDVAMKMVRDGHGIAVAQTPGSEDLVAAESAAHLSKLGMWAGDACGTGPLPSLDFVPRSSRPNPPGRDEDDLGAELVVVANRGRDTVDLTGWVLRDGSSLHRYLFAAGTPLGPGDTIIVDSADPAWMPGGSPVWSNQGDVAILLDPSGRVVARWRY